MLTMRRTGQDRNAGQGQGRADWWTLSLDIQLARCLELGGDWPLANYNYGLMAFTVDVVWEILGCRRKLCLDEAMNY